MSRPLVLLRGAGDLATGVAARLFRSGFSIVATEIEKPLALRRLVALAEAVYAREVIVEDLRAQLVASASQALAVIENEDIPVLVDPEAEIARTLKPLAIVDARMLKQTPPPRLDAEPMLIGLGPGFTVGVDAHAVIETNRGHYLGRVYWLGSAEPDTGAPGRVSGIENPRVLRAPASGELRADLPLGALVKKSQRIARIGGVDLLAPFDGALRGLMHDGLRVSQGEKIGDLDPRSNVRYCSEISEKALAIGGGVLEALLTRPAIRSQLGG